MKKYNYKESVLFKSGVDDSFWKLTVVPAIKRIKGDKCESCGSKDHLDVHHTSYIEQTIKTLMLLCRSCHIEWHKNNEVLT